MVVPSRTETVTVTRARHLRGHAGDDERDLFAATGKPVRSLLLKRVKLV